MAIIAFPALPPLFEQTPTATDELTLAREVLEHATLFAVSQQDDAAAERNFNQLRPYYSDCAGMIPPSPRPSDSVGTRRTNIANMATAPIQRTLSVTLF